MSIIYDALKKTQGKFTLPKDQPASQKKTKSRLWFFIGFLGLGFIGCGIVVILLLRNPVDISQSTTKPKDFSGRISRAIKFNRPQLKGIFLMDGEYSALINDQIVKAGNYFDGIQVVSVSANEVILNVKGEVLSLRLR
ncbi:hypothetical protein ACFL1E_01260 [Candidatus Omnitrophota bacterium]